MICPTDCLALSLIGIFSACASGQHVLKPAIKKGSPARGVYQIISKQSGKLLDVEGGLCAIQDGANIQQWQNLGADNQKWVVIRQSIPAGFYMIFARNSGRALSVRDSGTENGSKVQQWEINPGSKEHQFWSITPTGDGYYTIAAKNSGRILDVRERSNADGAKIQIWDWLGGDNQKWRLQLTGDQEGSTMRGKCPETTGSTPSGEAGSASSGESSRTYTWVNNRAETLFVYYGVYLNTNLQVPCELLKYATSLSKGQTWSLTVPAGNFGWVRLQTAQEPCQVHNNRMDSSGLRPARGNEPTSQLISIE